MITDKDIIDIIRMRPGITFQELWATFCSYYRNAIDIERLIVHVSDLDSQGFINNINGKLFTGVNNL
jgi:hypothetical protein